MNRWTAAVIPQFVVTPLTLIFTWQFFFSLYGPGGRLHDGVGGMMVILAPLAGVILNYIVTGLVAVVVIIRKFKESPITKKIAVYLSGTAIPTFMIGALIWLIKK